MIRRDVPLSDTPATWLLISQVEHARISGELATAWRAGSSPSKIRRGGSPEAPSPKALGPELLSAITHHDDGWASWEARPTIDPQSGRPYSFLELPREDSLPIWSDSIRLCRQFGPLAGWCVAGHFARLLRDSGDTDTPLAQAWLRETGQLQDQWLAEWMADDPASHTPSLADESLFFVRMFDWLSLWLCCQCPATPDDSPAEVMTLDEGLLKKTPVRFEPATSQAPGEPRTVHVSPWPFADSEINIDALGYTVPVKNFSTSEGLAKSRSPMRLRWRLMCD